MPAVAFYELSSCIFSPSYTPTKEDDRRGGDSKVCKVILVFSQRLIMNTFDMMMAFNIYLVAEMLYKQLWLDLTIHFDNVTISCRTFYFFNSVSVGDVHCGVQNHALYVSYFHWSWEGPLPLEVLLFQFPCSWNKHIAVHLNCRFKCRKCETRTILH